MAPESAVARACRSTALALVEERGAVGPQQGPVVLLEIGDALGEGRQGQSVGAEIHLALAEAHGERRAAPGAHHDVRPPGEDDRQGEGALQALHRLVHRLLGGALVLQLMGQEMGHDLGVGLGLEAGAQGDQLVAKLLEILDDAVMHDGDTVGGMGMGVGLVRPAMGRPAGMADAHDSRQRRARQQGLEIGQLALGTAAVDMAVHQGRDPGGIIAAIGQPLQPVDQKRRRGLPAENADDAAHGISSCSASTSASSPGTGLPSRASPLAAPCATARASAATSWVITLPAATTRTLADRDRRHQRAVGADEGARADHRLIFAEAVVIAGDGARRRHWRPRPL